LSLRICHVNVHSCARVFKIGWQQLLDGHKVHLVTERFIHGHPWKDFTAVHITESGHLHRGVANPDHLFSTIKTISPLIDVFWVHNEPDWIVKIVKEASNKPVIWDVHDMVSMRELAPNQYEEEALEYCDGISTVSGVYAENLRGRTTKPVEEILSCVPEFMFPQQRPSLTYNGLVYEGGLRGANTHSEQFDYRDWTGTFREITKKGIPMFAYNNSSGENLANYADTQTIFLGPLHMNELINNLTAHEVGLVGSPFVHPAFTGAMPNKLFDYIAAGLPVISLNAKTTTDFLEATGLGVGVNSVDEIPDAMNELLGYTGGENIRDYVWERGRLPWSMSGQIQKAYTLCNAVMK
jgi:hypothetical protein